MAKVTFSLPDNLLRAVDTEAARRGTTRSGLLRELAEQSMSRRSQVRAERMWALDKRSGDKGHKGRGAELVKSTRPAS